MKSMYHDSSVLPGGLTVIEAAKALLVLDLFALRATVNSLFMELVAADPFGAQTETAADAAQMIGQAIRDESVSDILSGGRVDFFGLHVSVPDWRAWGANAGSTRWDRTVASCGVLADELVRLGRGLEGAGLGDAAMSVRLAAEAARDIAES